MKKRIHSISVKSQAALEFITTYGWAFLVVMVMIGALAYFGILSPSKLLPNRCNFASEMSCLDYRIRESGADELRFRLKNNLAEPISVTSINVTSETGVQYHKLTGCTITPAMPFSPWSAGQVQEFILASTAEECTFAATGITSGDKGKFMIDVNYYPLKSGTNYNSVIKGEIFSVVI